MRKFSTAIAVLGLAALGLAAPGTSAQAAPQSVCGSKWPGRDGNVRAWEDIYCGGELLGVTAGNDANWNDSWGAFQGDDGRKPSSVMNSGYLGGRDVVAFYWNYDYAYQDGYVCLSPYERYADNLTDNKFTKGDIVVNDDIGSHQWVTASACTADSFLK
ncbi:hypothetical protein [Streptomyces sp.]|uniref:hypothetical protein n=1 Tax=Streptomyces sp. TaxID=1931 RepID=UPI002F954B54